MRKRNPRAPLLVMFGPRSPRHEAHLSFLDFTIFFKVFFLYNTFLIILKVIDGDYEYKILGEKLLREETPFQWVCKRSSLRSLWHKWARVLTLAISVIFFLMFLFNSRNELKKSLEYALGRTNTATPRVWSIFWSSHQRFYKQLW